MPEPQNAYDPTWNEEAGRWTVSFSVRGKRFRRRLREIPKTNKTLASRVAKGLYEEAWAEALTPVPAEPTTPAAEPFIVAAGRYIDKGHEARFVERIARSIVADAEIPSDISIDDIDDEVMQRLRKVLYAEAADQTVHRQLITPVKAVIKFAKTPWQETKVKVRDVPRTRWLTPEEAEQLLVAASCEEVVGRWDPRRETLKKIVFMLTGGAGPGEMLEVEASHLRPESGEVWIEKAKTDYRPRWVHLPPRAWQLMGDLPKNGKVFLTPQGKPYVIRNRGGGQIKGAFDTVRDAAGLGPDVTPYVLRHTWATWFLCQIGIMDTLKKRGGWANDRMVARYVKLAPADLNNRLIAHGWDFHPRTTQEWEFGELVKL
ncbi:Integrase [Roseivivax marinus]|uniref:tyrosine-type recombinase/integrase n=1 Tax=Roseivivax marinus TaxID=1379903 RepID=UPI0008B6CC1E|nr:tyrosine-type recombinase/integrase [Roseivivax marinus]SEK95197.1 Integrase [Roseivivax marinus]